MKPLKPFPTTLFLLSLSACGGTYADTVDDLVTFSAGTPARADEVNGNFSEVAGAVNGNDALITDLMTELSDVHAVLESLQGCPTLDPNDEMVRVGGVCIDRYEASIWDAPMGGNQITGPIPCSADGHDCDNIYARSVADVEPRGDITWFQAQQALANSGKRLPTNAEWQMVVAGTPDDGVSCNVDSGTSLLTGSLPDCVSRWGARDMVGNQWEWVADWLPHATTTACTWETPTGTFSDDRQGICGAAETSGPGALLRGGAFTSGSLAGPFAVSSIRVPSDSSSSIGFRGAR